MEELNWEFEDLLHTSDSEVRKEEGIELLSDSEASGPPPSSGKIEKTIKKSKKSAKKIKTIQDKVKSSLKSRITFVNTPELVTPEPIAPPVETVNNPVKIVPIAARQPVIIPGSVKSFNRSFNKHSSPLTVNLPKQPVQQPNNSHHSKQTPRSYTRTFTRKTPYHTSHRPNAPRHYKANFYNTNSTSHIPPLLSMTHSRPISYFHNPIAPHYFQGPPKPFFPPPQPTPPSFSQFPTQTNPVGRPSLTCLLCQGNHHTNICHIQMPYGERMRLLVGLKGLCVACLELNIPNHRCTVPTQCMYCSAINHATALCPLKM